MHWPAQTKLHSTVDKIAAPLAFFDDLTTIGEKLGLPLSADSDVAGTYVGGGVTSAGHPVVDVTSPDFLPLLRRVDECIDFLVQHVRTPEPPAPRCWWTSDVSYCVRALRAVPSWQPQFRDAGVYCAKYRQLQTRALAMIKSHVVNKIGAAGARAQVVFASGDNAAPALVSQHLYIEFRASCEAVGLSVDEIEQRATRKQCVVVPRHAVLWREVLLNESASHLCAHAPTVGGSHITFTLECYGKYLDVRLGLITRLVQAQLAAIPDTGDVLVQARTSCSIVVQACEAEHKLFHQLFGLTARDRVPGRSSGESKSASTGQGGTLVSAQRSKDPQDYMLDGQAAGLECVHALSRALAC